MSVGPPSVQCQMWCNAVKLAARGGATEEGASRDARDGANVWCCGMRRSDASRPAGKICVCVADSGVRLIHPASRGVCWGEKSAPLVSWRRTMRKARMKDNRSGSISATPDALCTSLRTE